MLNNQVKLLIVTGVTLALSGFLFWQGLGLGQKSPSPEPTVVQTQPLGASYVNEATPSATTQQDQNLGEQAVAVRVIDGDTIEVDLSGEKKKVRFIGIDTPETVDPKRPVGCFGKEASNESKRLVEGKTIYLQKDISETDKFGRLLRYVYLKLDDGSVLFVNDYLVRQGFAHAATFPPDIKYAIQFVAAQKQASENKRGLWSKC